MNPMETHSKNTVEINKVKKDIPFCTRYYNRPSVVTSTDSPTCTNDYFAEECDINLIVAKHTVSGLPLPSIDTAIYNLSAQGEVTGEVHGQFTNFVDRYLQAKENFMTLPSALRSKFNNDVSQFAEFINASSDKDISDLLKAYNVMKEEVTPAVGVQSDIKDNTNIGDNSVSPEG